MNANSSRVLGVIPARLASTRLPRKPLKLINGKTMIRRVWERALMSGTLSRLVVATDSEEIAQEVQSFGGNVVMTDSSLGTGTERAAQAARLEGGNWSAVVNIQGDMPFIQAEVIDGAVNLLLASSERYSMTTVATPLADRSAFESAHVVKVVLGSAQQALYFSRAAVPHSRDGALQKWAGEEVYGFKHLGLYVYGPDVLEFFSSSRPSTLESIEMLEQLRALEKGYRIGVFIAESRLTTPAVEVDTEADLRQAEQMARELEGPK